MEKMEMEVGDDESAHRVCSNADLLSKILAGLPLTSLRLSKSVCKRWSSLITDPCFNALRSRSPNAHHPCGLFLQLEQPSSLFAYLPLKTSSNPPVITTTSFPFHPTKSQYIEVLQSCNGLLLCYDCPGKYYVYNPFINHRKLLPLPRIWKVGGAIDYMGLAFDPALSPHYKLVYPIVDCTIPGNRVRLEIYSSETGNWVASPHTYDFSSFLSFGMGLVYWRGALHWLDGFHVYHFSLDDIHNPHFIQFEDHYNLCGLAFDIRDRLLVSPRYDCLLFVKMLPMPLQMNVYEMNDYSSGWSFKYHVDLATENSFSGHKLVVISAVFGEDSPFLVLEVFGAALIIQYNLISKTFYRLCDLTQIQHRDTLYCHFPFTPSLVDFE